MESSAAPPVVTGWFKSKRPHGTLAKARLFCVPHAGGTDSIFSTWPTYFGTEVEICALRLPGRGSRFGEGAISNMDQMATSIASAIRNFADLPFAIYGECSGALIALATARVLGNEFSPTHLFSSALSNPRANERRRRVSQMSTEDFKEEIVMRGLVPSQISSNAELFDLFAPQIRNDFELIESYRPSSTVLLNCPIITFSGNQDKAGAIPYGAWGRETKAYWRHLILPGPHLLTTDKSGELMPAIKTHLVTALTVA